MERIILTLMLLALILVFTIDTIQKRRGVQKRTKQHEETLPQNPVQSAAMFGARQTNTSTFHNLLLVTQYGFTVSIRSTKGSGITFDIL